MLRPQRKDRILKKSQQNIKMDKIIGICIKHIVKKNVVFAII